MEYRQLGRSGLVVSAVGLGTNNFGTRLDERAARAVLDEALDLGVTFLDTADVYGQGASESLLGRLLRGRRPQVVLATKVGAPMGASPDERGLSGRRIRRALEASLRRLDTDRVDLFQLHRPDPETPIAETLGTLDDLVREGKVRSVGLSNFRAWQLVDADWTARAGGLARPVAAQDHYSLLAREIEADLLPACRALGLSLVPYYPLESGFLTGKYRPGVTPVGARLGESRRAASVLSEANFGRLEAWEALARERGHTLVDLAFGWLLAQPLVASVIASASSAAQVRENVAAAAWRLGPEELARASAI